MPRFSPGRRSSASTVLPSGKSEALRFTSRITLIDAVRGSTSGERETSLTSFAGDLERGLLAGPLEEESSRCGLDARRGFGPERHHDPEWPDLHEAAQGSARGDGLAGRDQKLGDAAGPGRAHHHAERRILALREVRRDRHATLRGSEPGFETRERRPRPLELRLARGFEAQELDEALHPPARDLHFAFERRGVRAQLRKASAAQRGTRRNTRPVSRDVLARHAARAKRPRSHRAPR